MFGFISINEQDLSEAELDRYKQVYCGVCRSLQQRSGQLSRLTLSNDLTFVGMLLASLYEPAETKGKLACPAHPLAKRAFVGNEFLDYAADMTVLMAYHSLRDHWIDDHSRPAQAAAAVLKGAYDHVAQRFPRQCKVCERGLARIAQIEDEDNPQKVNRRETEGSPDACAHEFGLIMAEVLVYQEDIWAHTLRAFGYELGRFIYMMDAAYDLEDDMASGSYNPFAGRDLAREEIRSLLGAYIARAAAYFERLPLERDVHILRSVLYAGVWSRLNAQDAQLEAQSAPQVSNALLLGAPQEGSTQVGRYSCALDVQECDCGINGSNGSPVEYKDEVSG